MAVASDEDQAGAYETEDQHLDLLLEGEHTGVFRLGPSHGVEEEDDEGDDRGVAGSRTTGRLPEDIYRKGRKAGEALRVRAVELSERYNVDLHTVFKIMQLAFDPPRTSSWNDFLQWFKQMRNEDHAFAERHPCNSSKYAIYTSI